MDENVKAEVCATRAKYIEKRIDANDAKIDKLTDCINTLTLCQAQAAEIIKQNKEILEQYQISNEKLEARITKLELEPADKWKKAIGSIVTAIVGGLVAYVLFKIGLG